MAGASPSRRSIIASHARWSAWIGSGTSVRKPMCEGRRSRKATEQRDLAGIPDWRWARIGADADVQPDDRAKARQLVDAHSSDDTALDPSDVSPRDPRLQPDRFERPPEGLPSDAKFVPDPDAIGRGEPMASVDRALPSGHRRSLATITCLTLTCEPWRRSLA